MSSTPTSTSPPAYSNLAALPQDPSYYAPRVRDFQPYVEPSDTPRTTLPPYHEIMKHSMYKSEDHYLSTLKEWAEDKQWDWPSGNGLEGFYGKKTLTEYAEQANKGKARKVKKETVEVAASDSSTSSTESSSDGRKKRGSISKWWEKRMALD